MTEMQARPHGPVTVEVDGDQLAQATMMLGTRTDADTVHQALGAVIKASKAKNSALFKRLAARPVRDYGGETAAQSLRAERDAR